MMKSEKFLILVRKNSGSKYRVKRVCQELEKLELGFDIVSTNEVIVLSNKAFYQEKKIHFDDYKAVLSLGTSDENIYLVDLARKSNLNIKFWPNPEKDCLKDKFYEILFLNSIKVKTPKTVLLDSLENKRIENVARYVNGFPCVIKKVTGASGDYVRLINSANEVIQFVEDFTQPRVSGKRNIILQEYIKEAKGFDFRVYCVGTKVLGTIKRSSGGDDFRSNVSLGGNAKAFNTPMELKLLAERIMQKSGLLFAGIDFIKNKQGFLAIEINVSANFKAFESATGVNVAKEIVCAMLEV